MLSKLKPLRFICYLPIKKKIEDRETCWSRKLAAGLSHILSCCHHVLFFSSCDFLSQVQITTENKIHSTKRNHNNKSNRKQINQQLTEIRNRNQRTHLTIYPKPDR
ncbi:hypothetical protein ACFFRR_002145 [Megaselia abdita]